MDQHEIRIRGALRNLNRAYWSSIAKLAVCWPIFALGIAKGYRDDLLDSRDSARYGLEEFRGQLATLKERGTPYRVVAFRLPDDATGYDGWLATDDQYPEDNT